MSRTSVCLEHWKSLTKNKSLPEQIQAAESLIQQWRTVSKPVLCHLLQACTALKDPSAAKHLHSLFIAMGIHTMPFMCDHLIRMYASCGRLHDALDVFHHVSHPSIYTWNAIISAHSHLHQHKKAIALYFTMLQQGVIPDKFTFLCTLKACCKLGDHLLCMCMHDSVVRFNLDCDLVVMNTVIDTYAKCGLLAEASQVFFLMEVKDVVSWGALIAGHATHGDCFNALQLFAEMQEVGEEPHLMLFASLLKACGGLRAIMQGWWVHDRIYRRGFECDVVIGSTLVDMYAKCGDMEVAHILFDRLRHRDVVSWAALIAGYAAADMGIMALEAYVEMQREGVKPDNYIFSSALKASSSIKAVCHGMWIHDQVMRCESQLNVVVGSTLVNFYGMCGLMGAACNVFDRLPDRNILSWGALIACFVQEGHGPFALLLFGKMYEEGLTPDKVVFACILQVCGRLGAMQVGYLVHAQILVDSNELNEVVARSLLDMYIECGNMEGAQAIFSRLPDQGEDTWGLIMKGYCHCEEFSLALDTIEKMQRTGVIMLDKLLFLDALKACGKMNAIDRGQCIHDQIVKNGWDLDLVIGSTLVDMYGNCGSLEEARQVFDGVTAPDVVAWGAMMAAYAQHSYAWPALQLFELMQNGSVEPDRPILCCVAKACNLAQAIQQGHMIHDQLVRTGLESDVVVENTIIGMYANCECLEEAQRVFDRQCNHDLVSWSIIMTAYAQSGHSLASLELFEKTQQEDLQVDSVLLSCAVNACGNEGTLKCGLFVHDQIVKNGCESNEMVGCALICMYAKCGDIEDAHKVFDMVESQDEVTWGELIAAYVMHGHGQCAHVLYERMKKASQMPNEATVVWLLKACGHNNLIEQGLLLHNHVMKCGSEAKLSIANSVLDMYAKWGRIQDLFQVFSKMPSRDTVTWSILMSAAGADGRYAGLVKDWVKELQVEGLRPDDAIYTSLLGACSQVGSIKEGLSFFSFSNIAPSIEHFSCIADLFGRSGRLNVAEDIIQTMPIPKEILMWTSFLNSCKTYGSVELGQRSADNILRLDPDDTSANAIMANIQADAKVFKVVEISEGLRTGPWKEVDKFLYDKKLVHNLPASQQKFSQRNWDKPASMDGVMECTGYAPVRNEAEQLHALGNYGAVSCSFEEKAPKPLTKKIQSCGFYTVYNKNLFHFQKLNWSVPIHVN